MKIIEVWDNKTYPPICHPVKVDDDVYEKVKDYAWIWRDGYAAVRYQRHYYQMHRMIMDAFWKEDIIIDHIDGDHHNNQRSNLRRADRFQNQQNRKTNKNNTLPKGVRMLPSGRYNVRVQSYGKRVVVGTYDTPEEAIEAYNNYASKVNGEFFRPSHPISKPEANL